MVKRSRLSRSGRLAGNPTRLRSQMRSEMMTYSDKLLVDLSSSHVKVRSADPVMQMLYELAKDEIVRRRHLRKQWGRVVGQTPREQFVQEISGKFKPVRLLLSLPEKVYSGRLEHDIEHATNYFFDKLDHFLHKGRNAKERWNQFAVAHGLAKRTSTDFIKAGYDVVNRYAYDADPAVLKREFLRYREKYPRMVVVPSVVDNKRYYDIMVRMRT